MQFDAASVHYAQVETLNGTLNCEGCDMYGREVWFPLVEIKQALCKLHNGVIQVCRTLLQ